MGWPCRCGQVSDMRVRPCYPIDGVPGNPDPICSNRDVILESRLPAGDRVGRPKAQAIGYRTAACGRLARPVRPLERSSHQRADRWRGATDLICDRRGANKGHLGTHARCKGALRWVQLPRGANQLHFRAPFPSGPPGECCFPPVRPYSLRLWLDLLSPTAIDAEEQFG
jgi:hypothetical protein